MFLRKVHGPEEAKLLAWMRETFNRAVVFEYGIEVLTF